MFADGTTVPASEVVQTEVCIVGAGVAGLTLARELGSSGVEVVLLERGAETGRPSAPDTAINVGSGSPFNRSRACGFSMDGSQGRGRGWVDVRG